MEYLRSPKICTSATPVNALQRVLHVNVDVVADELVVVAIVVAVEAGRHDERGGDLVDGHAGVLDFVGQTAQSRPETRFCTSTAAISSGRVSSKAMVMELLPSLPLLEVM